MKYEIKGEPLPAVTCYLSAGETMITERGSMAWMTPNMKMDTTSNGGIGKALGRMFAGEALFQNKYTAEGGDGMITFVSSFPGSIVPFQITPDRPMIVQKCGFLASEAGIELSMHFQKKIASGFFGGEGFIMQKLSGTGMAFIEIDGFCVEYSLEAGQKMIIDTGYLAAMDASVSVDIQTMSSVKNALFGGEGLFNTVCTGPGKIYLQTMPVSAVAGALRPYFPSSSN